MSEDRRSTKRILADTMMQLLRSKTFEQIHISDVCNEARFHRTVFYYYFQDKTAVLEYLLNDIMKGYKNKLLRQKKGGTLTELETYQFFMETVWENQGFFRILLQNNLLHVLANHLIRYHMNPVSVLNGLNPNSVIDNPEFLKYYIPFYSSGICSVVFRWLEEEDPSNCHEMADLLYRLYRPGFRTEFLENPNRIRYDFRED